MGRVWVYLKGLLTTGAAFSASAKKPAEASTLGEVHRSTDMASDVANDATS